MPSDVTDRDLVAMHVKRIVLKPNLVEFDPNTAINTHPMVVHAALDLRLLVILTPERMRMLSAASTEPRA